MRVIKLTIQANTHTSTVLTNKLTNITKLMVYARFALSDRKWVHLVFRSWDHMRHAVQLSVRTTKTETNNNYGKQLKLSETKQTTTSHQNEEF